MTNNDIKELCIDLAKSESEKEVVRILSDAKLWDKKSVWVDYDRNPNNFSTIGNQQSSPDTALVEKLINSVDAVLTRECWRRGIKPDSANAPQSISEALKDFFGIYDGKLSSIDASQRANLAENIHKALSAYSPPEENSYYAHITLLRVKKISRPVYFFDSLDHIKIRQLIFFAEEFFLMQSILTHEGSKYNILERFVLTE